MAWRRIGTKQLPEPMLAYCQLDSWEQISVKFESEFYHFRSRKCIWKCCLPKWLPFCPGEDELSSFIPHFIMLNSPVATPVASGDVVGQLEFPNSLLSRRLDIPNSKVHGANMGPIWGRQDPGGPHVGPMNPAFWVFGQPLKGNNEKSVTLNWYVLALHNSVILSASILDHYGVFHINVSGHIWINHHIVRSCTWKGTCAIDTQRIGEIQATNSMLTRWY